MPGVMLVLTATHSIDNILRGGLGIEGKCSEEPAPFFLSFSKKEMRTRKHYKL